MTLERRLAKIDETLSPTQLVLRWLAEAHVFGDIEPYVLSILDAPGPEQPMDRLCREASEGARTRLRGKPAEQVRAAVHSALRETLFRYELVLRIYETTHELLDSEGLIDALGRPLSSRGRTRKPGPGLIAGQDDIHPQRLCGCQCHLG
ncbi:MAG: hypothetical protein ABSG37_04950 [Candidatus Limnocylindrales bacterium]|jgi:hypothetical protein